MNIGTSSDVVTNYLFLRFSEFRMSYSFPATCVQSHLIEFYNVINLVLLILNAILCLFLVIIESLIASLLSLQTLPEDIMESLIEITHYLLDREYVKV